MDTKNAGELTLCAVNQQAILDLLIEMGGVERFDKGEFNPRDPQTIVASNRLLTYTLGWGVVNTPPPEALEMLAALGKPTHLAPIARAHWLRYLALDETELTAVVAEVMRLTFKPEG